ncbi:MAG TPA: hypothetical protein VF533_25660 [Solirubrobacteraceae bacterium]
MLESDALGSEEVLEQLRGIKRIERVAVGEDRVEHVGGLGLETLGRLGRERRAEAVSVARKYSTHLLSTNSRDDAPSRSTMTSSVGQYPRAHAERSCSKRVSPLTKVPSGSGTRPPSGANALTASADEEYAARNFDANSVPFPASRSARADAHCSAETVAIRLSSGRSQ